MIKLLLVEDDPTFSYIVKSGLQEIIGGYEVITAMNGKEGLKAWEEYHPDIIISDIVMPVLEGDELCRILKSSVDTSHIPVILLTALSERENIIFGLEAGANDYIIKPFDLSVLKVRIRNILQNRQHLRDTVLSMDTPPEDTDYTSQLDKEFMDKVMETIEKHLDNGDLTVEDIAGEVNMSRSVFFKKLKTLTGLSPVEFLKEIRMKRAAQLIETEEYNMAQIAYMVGLNDSHYFSKCFKQQYGMTPTEYKESRKQN